MVGVFESRDTILPQIVVDLNFIHVTQLSSKLPFYECESIITMSPKNAPPHIESATTCYEHGNSVTSVIE